MLLIQKKTIAAKPRFRTISRVDEGCPDCGGVRWSFRQGHLDGSVDFKCDCGLAIRFRPVCPECGADGGVEYNGASRASDASFCCTSCGEHWDVIPL